MNKLRCPRCGYRFHVYTLACNPPSYEGDCGNCEFTMRYYKRKDAGLKITQEELNKREHI